MQQEFAHGGGVEAFAKELGIKVDEVIDLSSNINFLKPSIAIDFNKISIDSYPTYDDLYKKIAKKYGVNISNIALTNGGSSAIFSLFEHLKLKHCTIYSPAYLEYKKAAGVYGYEYDLINRFTQLDRAVAPNSLVIFVNPSTPDGKYYEIEQFLKQWEKLNCTILIDESFLDFTNHKSVVKYIQQYKNLYILKSMTKFYSCAGVRCGTIISSKENIGKFKTRLPMWPLSQFDSCYLQGALEDTVFNKTAKAINIKNYMLLKQVLENCELISKLFCSDANFILVKLKTINSFQLQQHLKKYNIMVRDCSNFDFLDSSYVRIAVKNEKSINILKKALQEYTG